MVYVGHVRMRVGERFVRMPVAVRPARHDFMGVIVVAVVMPMRMFVVQGLVFMLMTV